MKKIRGIEFCPNCGGENITYCDFAFTAGEAWEIYACDDCDSEWRMVYKFSHVEDYETELVITRLSF